MENEKDTFKAFIQSCLDFVVNNKKEEKVCNEDVDKRKLIDEVAGIMKSAGCDDEDIRTAIGKMEKIFQSTFFYLVNNKNIAINFLFFKKLLKIKNVCDKKYR